MTPEELRRVCLAYSGAAEERPFGPQTSVFKVEGKMFALSALDAEPLKVSLKCEPALADELRRSYPGIVPGYHLNKRHWNTVEVGSVPERLLLDLIEDSYDLVVGAMPRAKRERLGWTGEPGRPAEDGG
jgi:predicted DNA-binding protein (MmcQ/YjbR family)